MLQYALFVLASLAIAFTQPSEQIIGKWKLTSYGAISKIRSSPAYIMGDETAREMIEKQFKAILENGHYSFAEDTLIYTDLNRDKIVNRRATWLLSGDTLVMNEIDRPYMRMAYVRLLNADSLIMNPIIEGEIGDSDMVFIRTSED